MWFILPKGLGFLGNEKEEPEQEKGPQPLFVATVKFAMFVCSFHSLFASLYAHCCWYNPIHISLKCGRRWTFAACATHGPVVMELSIMMQGMRRFLLFTGSALINFNEARQMLYRSCFCFAGDQATQPQHRNAPTGKQNKRFNSETTN